MLLWSEEEKEEVHLQGSKYAWTVVSSYLINSLIRPPKTNFVSRHTTPHAGYKEDSPYNRFLTEKRVGSPLVKNSPRVKKHPVSLSWARWIQTTLPHSVSSEQIFIFSSHLRIGLQSQPHAFLFTHQRAIYPTYLIDIQFVTLIIWLVE